jgi:hypothetical protein
MLILNFKKMPELIDKINELKPKIDEIYLEI